MRKQTTAQLSRALDDLANGLAEIREMGLLELRFKFKGVLAKVEKSLRVAAEALAREEG